MERRYAGYDVLRKWSGPSFNPRTREVLARRLESVPPRRFLSAEEWSLLEAIVARLVPQPDRVEPIPITPWIDEQLLEERGEGFRRDGVPRLGEAWRRGLGAIDGEARRRHGAPFDRLDGEAQAATLRAIQAGDVDRALWGDVPAELFFVEMLLKTVAGLYYAHPAAWNEIGFGGPAGPRGYVRLGFDERDPWEAREVP